MVLDKHIIKIKSITGFVKATDVKEQGIDSAGADKIISVFRFSIFFDGTRVDFYFQKEDEALVFQDNVLKCMFGDFNSEL